MMTLSLRDHERTGSPRSAARGLATAFGLGVAAVAAAAGIYWLLAAPPPGEGSWIGLGAGAAVGAAGLAMGWHALLLRATAARNDAAAAGFRLQALLAGSILAKLAVLVIAVLSLQRSGTKFEHVAAFAIAFAAASLVFQVTAAGYLSRRAVVSPGTHTDN